MIYFSKSTDGFYNTSIFKYDLPGDAVEISAEVFSEMRAAQVEGKVIGLDSNGVLVAFEEPLDISRPILCTPAQGLVALFALKQITEDDVLAAIAQISDPVQQYTARIGYQRATTWERGSPMMLAMAQLLQLSEQDLDELFTHAVTVQI